MIPGVSGGTVALILGIYDRLVRAVSRFDLTFLRHLRKREWSAAAEHVDFRFLLTLGIGIVTGILGLASLLHYLIEDQEHVTLHSVNEQENVVRLNVGTAKGGIPVNTVLHVVRWNFDTGGYKSVGNLRVESYSDKADPESDSPRVAEAKPLGELTATKVQADDVVVHPSTRRPLTLAAFFGMILASGILVGRMMDRWTMPSLLAAVVGAVAAYWLVGLFPIKPWEGNAYLFFCGMLGICAMILPGISGAFILLVLGVYSDITGALRSVLSGSASPETLLNIAVFVAGCAIGLLSFSKLLHRLLGRHRNTTMAVLCGVMLGSLRKIWPFKHDLTPYRPNFGRKLFENIWPTPFDGRVWAAFGIIAVAAAFVFLLDYFTAGQEQHPHEESGQEFNPTKDEPGASATGDSTVDSL